MEIRNFWYSYKNILIGASQKNIILFLRRILGILFKFIIKFLRYNYSSKIINLDKFEKKFYKLKLDDLFIQFNSDKGSHFISNQEKIISHNYADFYEKYFLNKKNNKLKILELGSHEGKGIAGFYFFFPNSKLVGANINPFQMKFKSERISELYIDVSSKKIIKNFANHFKYEFDIIIDDASHNLRDILITFSILFKKLKKGGIYVIEDLDQFHVFKELNPYKNELTPKEILNKIKHNKDFQSSFIDDNEKKYLVENIQTINLEKGKMIINSFNVSDIAFIKKI